MLKPIGGVDPKAKAITYYAKAAESGDSNAQFQMGYAYFSGIGIEKNIEKGIPWFEKAAEQNHEVAQYNLGRFYLFHAPTDRLYTSKGFGVYGIFGKLWLY